MTSWSRSQNALMDMPRLYSMRKISKSQDVFVPEGKEPDTIGLIRSIANCLNCLTVEKGKREQY